MMQRRLLVALALGVALAPTEIQAQEKLPPGTKLVRLEAQPSALRLEHPYDYAQLLLTGITETGDRIDVARMPEAQWEVSPGLVDVSPTGLVRPKADGTGTIRFRLGGQSVAVALTVSGQKAKYTVSFVRDVMPALSKMGCNAGTCHGAAQGKNGFKLSLRGYDPLFDHTSLTDDVQGRRFNRAAPDHSLMLLKTSGSVPHVGGVLTKPGEPYYELLRAWIAAGVQLDLQAPRVTALEVFPKGPIVPLPGMKQQMAVLATYADGKVRDVTAEAFLESSNIEVATVDRAGLVTAVRRGEGAILARYEGAYAATSLIVMGDRSGFAWREVTPYTYIDALVYEKLKQVKILPSELCSDAEFIRRVYLDLTGLPPQPEEVRAFLADPRPSRARREALVDQLVGSEAYVEHWTNKWADLLQVNRKFLGDQGAQALRGWIRNAVATNMPYDQFVRTILTASGSTLENPPASYFKVLRDAPSAMENTTQLFLAVRFNCNKCHDHPFERWTQDQYYHLAAYLAQVGRKEDPKYKGQRIGGSAVEGALALVEVITDEKAGDVKHDRTGQVTPPAFPYHHADMPPAGSSRRDQLAHWLTSRENPYFARSYVNRLWSYLLGVGLIEPVDDIRAGNPPSNPKLLERLTNQFIASGFNVQEMFRTICKSRVYQHSIVTNQWNADDEVNYSHAIARRLPAEVIYDAIHRATGAVSRIPGLPPGIRAAQLLDSNVPVPSGFLDLFGKPPRESACECERSSGMMLGPVLNLVNGPVLADAIKDPENRIARLVATQADDRKLLEELYLAILCRLPTPQEIAGGLQALRSGEQEYPKLLAAYEERAATVARHEKQMAERQPQWEAEVRSKSAWHVLDVAEAKSAAGATLTRQPDGSLLASGPNGTPETYTVTATTLLKEITALRLEVLTDPSLPSQGPGRAPNGNFVLNKLTLAAGPRGTAAPAAPAPLGKATATFSQDGFAVERAVDNDPNSGWAIAPQLGQRHVAVFELRKPVSFPEGARLTITLDQRFPGKEHNIGKFRLSATSTKPPYPFDGLPDAVVKALAVEPAQRTDAQKAEITRYYHSTDPELARLRQVLAEYPRPTDKRLIGAQDIAWALMNSPAFLFNH